MGNQNMRKSELQSHLQEYAELINERSKTYSDWLKSILTISTTLLAILVALKTEKSANDSIHIAYLSVIISTSVGIFLGVIILYSDVKILSKTIKAKSQHIQNAIDGEDELFEPI